jgi:hypothetical protein
MAKINNIEELREWAKSEQSKLKLNNSFQEGQDYVYYRILNLTDTPEGENGKDR